MQRALSWRASIAVAALIALTSFLGIITVSHNRAQDESSCLPGNLRTSNWSTDFCNTIVDFNEILVGNPVKDGIPALTNLDMESVQEAATWLDDRSPVIALQINGEARAYPQAILMWQRDCQRCDRGYSYRSHILPTLQQLDHLRSSC